MKETKPSKTALFKALKEITNDSDSWVEFYNRGVKVGILKLNTDKYNYTTKKELFDRVIEFEEYIAKDNVKTFQLWFSLRNIDVYFEFTDFKVGSL